MSQLKKSEIRALRKSLPSRPEQVVLVLENIQYARNVAAMFRTADAAGVNRIFLTGISKQPPFGKELQQVSRHKEKSVQWQYFQDTNSVINKLKGDGFFIIAIELAEGAISHQELPAAIEGKQKICFILGSEVYGVKESTLQATDLQVYVPMYGKGASLNVTASGAVVLYSF
ncbi:MAG: hypothetical protein JNK26_04045 [Candidatus Doudnabacteria bacterium]|nr:hypothetical protein [Candidatus Doudnabacteria bacterium]